MIFLVINLKAPIFCQFLGIIFKKEVQGISISNIIFKFSARNALTDIDASNIGEILLKNKNDKLDLSLGKSIKKHKTI